MKEKKFTAYETCLVPLLKALHWRGTRRQLKESLPHYKHLGSVYMLCDVLQHLNFEAQEFSMTVGDIDERFLPCLFVSEVGKPSLILSKNDKQIELFDPVRRKKVRVLLDEGNRKSIEGIDGKAFVFKRKKVEEYPIKEKPRWIRKAYLNNRPLVYSAIGISFFLSLFALVTPLFIMFVYNFVIKANSVSMLLQFFVGAAIALIGFSILSKLRTKQLSIVGARLDRVVGDQIFQRLLYLSPNYIESASVGSQVARLKDFSRLREYVTGQLMTTSFEIPFILTGIVIIALLGGLLVFIPLIAIAFYVFMVFFMYRELRRRLFESGRKGAKEQEFVLEAVKKLRALKYTASLETWEKRQRDLSADATFDSFRNVILSGVNSAISDFVTIATGMLVLGFGAVRIIDGTLSVGAMLAIMILSWRILAPIKTVFNMYPRVIQMGNSLRQITKLMRIKSEVKSTDLGRSRLFGLRGEITFRQVSLRYPNAYQPALIGVDFNVKPGEQVAITGRNGSGKSSIFKLLLRMCQQQMGSVLIDQQDIRQFNEIELRSVIGYLPQVPELFYGTIADNIRLSSPGATDEDVEKVAARVGILDTIRTLPKGIHAHIRDFSTEKLSVGFQRSLCLARALLKQAPILLLDEPTSGLDEKANENLLHILENLRGKITVLIVTYRPSYMKLMDKVLVLDDGRLILQGPPNQVMPEIIKEIV